MSRAHPAAHCLQVGFYHPANLLSSPAPALIFIPWGLPDAQIISSHRAADEFWVLQLLTPGPSPPCSAPPLSLVPQAAPFKVRGPTYLKDKKKIAAGDSVFTLAAVDLVALPHAVDHIARYLPSIR